MELHILRSVSRSSSQFIALTVSFPAGAFRVPSEDYSPSRPPSLYHSRRAIDRERKATLNSGLTGLVVYPHGTNAQTRSASEASLVVEALMRLELWTARTKNYRRSVAREPQIIPQLYHHSEEARPPHGTAGLTASKNGLFS